MEEEKHIKGSETHLPSGIQSRQLLSLPKAGAVVWKFHSKLPDEVGKGSGQQHPMPHGLPEVCGPAETCHLSPLPVRDAL